MYAIRSYYDFAGEPRGEALRYLVELLLEVGAAGCPDRARRAPGSMTPTTGRLKRSSRAGRATEEAVLQATTSIFTPCATKKAADSSYNFV